MTPFRIFTLLILLAISLPTAQAQKRLMRIGNEAYEAGEYHVAAEKFKKAYGRAKERSQKSELAYKLGMAYTKLNQPRYARGWLRTAIVYKYPAPELQLHYAQVLMKLQNYSGAKEAFEEYTRLVPDDPRGEIGIESCEIIPKWKEEGSRFQVSPVKGINSRQYSDFSPSYAGGPDLVYFTSTREAASGDQLSGVTGMAFTDIFYSMQDRKGDWSEPVPARGNINTEYDEGAPYLVDDGFTMYYTGCKIVKNQEMGCKIYLSERSGQSWGEPAIIQLFRDSAISVGHPAVSEDGLTLYFAADHPEGVGGKDIWVSRRESPSDKWEEPENLGREINTQGNELYPYIRSNGELFFSSNGRVGMGGLDIYKATKDADGNWQVENMRPPINSFEDDFGITFEYGEDRGLFSSTRDGRLGEDNIYAFRLPPLQFALTGNVLERETEKPLDATVKLFGSDGTIKELKATDEGFFEFELDEATDYRVVTTKEDYLKGKGRETTRGLKEDKVLSMTIYMAPIDKPIELPNILYDLNSAELRPESMVALDGLVETLNDNPNITIELASHTDFRDSESYNQELSQRRAQSVVDYLIDNGIDPERLTPRGYGESTPRTVNEGIAEEYEFLSEGDVLDEQFIKALPNEQQIEIAHQINRRTEFTVLSTDYKINNNE